MNKHWTVEIHRNGKFLEWAFFRVEDGLWVHVEGSSAVNVSEMFVDVVKTLEDEIPEVFS